MDLDARKPVFVGLRTTKVQTSLCSLISAFVIRFLERTICKLAIGDISIFLLVSVAEETGLNLTLSETPRTGFVAVRTIEQWTHINMASILWDIGTVQILISHYCLLPECSTKFCTKKTHPTTPKLFRGCWVFLVQN